MEASSKVSLFINYTSSAHLQPMKILVSSATVAKAEEADQGKFEFGSAKIYEIKALRMERYNRQI